MKHLFSLLLIIIALSTQAQKKQNVYYFDKNNIEIKNPDSSYYSRIIQEPDSGSTFYNLIEIYKTGKIKTQGTVSDFEPKLIYEGTTVKNYQNEKKASISNYKKGVLIGSEYLYYENGLLKEERLYLENKEKTFNPKRIVFKTISFNNPQGKEFLDENGTGTFNLEHENGNWEKGTYLNGLKVGTWQAYDKKENETYTDEYKEGVYISGKTTKANGEILTYQEIQKVPEFKGGLQAFGKFLGKNLNYPAEARDRRIMGRVYTSFIVENNGVLTNFKVDKGIGYGCNEEALRVIQLSPTWLPGLERGIPVRVFYTIPIFFQIQ
jgi:TonB family protein